MRYLILFILLISPLSLLAQTSTTTPTPEPAQDVIEANIAIAWEPEGWVFALGGTEGLKVLDIRTGTTFDEFEVNETITTIEWKPDGNALLGGTSDGKIYLWDANSWEALFSFMPFPDSSQDPAPIIAVKWQHDSTRFATVSNVNDIPTIRIYDSATLELDTEFYIYPSGVGGKSWGLDSTALLLTDSKTGIYGLDADLNLVMFPRINNLLLENTEPVAATISSDGSQIAVATTDNTIGIWDIATDELLHTLTGHTDEIVSLSWNTTSNNIHISNRLVSASLDGTSRSWDTLSGENHNVMEHDKPVHAAAWSPKSWILVLGLEYQPGEYDASIYMYEG